MVHAPDKVISEISAFAVLTDSEGNDIGLDADVTEDLSTCVTHPKVRRCTDCISGMSPDVACLRIPAPGCGGVVSWNSRRPWRSAPPRWSPAWG